MKVIKTGLGLAKGSFTTTPQLVVALCGGVCVLCDAKVKNSLVHTKEELSKDQQRAQCHENKRLQFYKKYKLEAYCSLHNYHKFICCHAGTNKKKRCMVTPVPWTGHQVRVPGAPVQGHMHRRRDGTTSH